MVPQWLKDFLAFNKAERNAIIILIISLIALAGYNVYQRIGWNGKWKMLSVEYGKFIAQFQEQMDTVISTTHILKKGAAPPAQLFQFNPNKLDSAGWVQLGFSPKQTAAIINYRNAGARFYKPQDLKKLFVVDSVRYNQLAPFVVIPNEVAEKPVATWVRDTPAAKPAWTKPVYVPKSIELNSTDSAMLTTIRGIGPFFAKVMLEHRAKLGGYIHKNQVLEVYGMDSVKFARIEAEIWVDSSKITKLNVNHATLKELVRHPYISFNQAKAIVNYRQQHGSYQQLSDLKKIHLISSETYDKIAPYCTVH